MKEKSLEEKLEEKDKELDNARTNYNLGSAFIIAMGVFFTNMGIHCGRYMGYQEGQKNLPDKVSITATDINGDGLDDLVFKYQESSKEIVFYKTDKGYLTGEQTAKNREATR